MDRSSPPLSVTISFAWWLRVYLFGVMVMTKLTGADPNWARIEPKIKRAMRIMQGSRNG